MVQGIECALPGFDLDTCDPKDLVFSSRYNSLKLKTTGTLTGAANVNHGLSYTPVFFAMHKQVGTYTRYSACWGTIIGDVGVNATNLRVNNSGETVRYYLLYQQAI